MSHVDCIVMDVGMVHVEEYMIVKRNYLGTKDEISVTKASLTSLGIQPRFSPLSDI